MSQVEHLSKWVGQSRKRVEDPRLITGGGAYLEDLRIDNVADVSLVRSPYAHARIRSIDIEAARKMPGVVAVITASDLVGVGGVPVGGNLKVPEHLPLAKGTVKFVGDPVVAVIAESMALAQDARDAVVVDYEQLPVVVDPMEALDSDSPIVHDEFDSNVTLSAEFSTEGFDEAFNAAEHHLAVHVGHARVAAIPIENRGGIGLYDSESGQYTLWLSTQAAWIERGDLATALGVPEEQVRVITPDVGGAFGAKMTAYREDILLLALARIVGRPVRWIATRSEDLLSSMHGREMATDGEVAFDSDGTIRALRLQTVANFGAYLMKYSGGPPMRLLLFPSGAYTIRHVDSVVNGVFTNTGPVGPYRGAGRPEAAYFIERAMSDVANALGMDQAEIRRRNFIPADAFPYTNASNQTYDTGNYERALDAALDLIDYPTLTAEIAERRQRGEIVGVGIASCVEVSGGGGEGGTVELREDGTVVALTGTSPHGQGLATSFAQIISDELGVAPEAVRLDYGDTSEGTRGGGTMGSRSLQLGGNALWQAAQEVRQNVLNEASQMLEVAPGDLELFDGMVGPIGARERAIKLGDVVRAIRAHPREELASMVNENGIVATIQYQSGGSTYPFGSTIAVVSIDPRTGSPTLERFVSVDDVGNVINPMLVEGQLIGGAVQGIGEVLWERVVYDDNGQLLTGTLMDYAMPHASQLPMFELDRTVTPTPLNPLGAKGVGEAGTVHATPAVANAIMDALRQFNVKPIDLPITEQQIWQIMNAQDPV